MTTATHAQHTELPIACRISSAELDERIRRDLTIPSIFSSCLGVKEVDRGYAFQFSGDGAHVARLAEWIILERECCRFFDFSLEFEEDAGSVWLCLCGPQGTKQFIEENLLPMLTPGAPPIA